MSILFCTFVIEKETNHSPTATRSSRTTMTKQITAERAIEAINICSEFMTDEMIAYQSTLFPKCVTITGQSCISSMELESLVNAGFYCQISTSDINNWGIDIRIYDMK